MHRFASDLKQGEKITIAAIPMEFSHWDKNSPAFTHTADKHIITYVNRQFNTLTPVKDLK